MTGDRRPGRRRDGNPVPATVMVRVVKRYGEMKRRLPVSGRDEPRVTPYERRRNERRDGGGSVPASEAGSIQEGDGS